ncbi:MAG: ATP-binding domain-containing protein, partial [Pseudonocardiaceae bacterium]
LMAGSAGPSLMAGSAGPSLMAGSAGPSLIAGSAGPSLMAGSAGLDAPVTVLTVTQAKGLEFDAVVLVDPAAILAESPRGLNDLYVALTRSTQRLCIAHSGELPPVLSRLTAHSGDRTR